MQGLNQVVNQAFSQSGTALFLVLWSIFWKGWALWKSASKRQLLWFIFLLVFNTLGILEILYIFYLNRFDIDKEGRLLRFLEKKVRSKK